MFKSQSYAYNFCQLRSSVAYAHMPARTYIFVSISTCIYYYFNHFYYLIFRSEGVELSGILRRHEETIWRNRHLRIFRLLFELTNDVGDRVPKIVEAIQGHQQGMLNLNEDRIK